MDRNASNLWPERILVLGFGWLFFVGLHRDLPPAGWMFVGGTLTIVGILIALLRKVLSRFRSVMWGLEKEEEAYRFLYLEVGFVVALGGGSLLLRAMS
jgi:hypothetical protein